MSTFRRSSFAAIGALAAVATTTVDAKEQKFAYAPSTEAQENSVLSCFRQNLSINSRFDDIKGEVVGDAGLAAINGSNAISYFAKVRGTVTNAGKTFAFQVTDGAAYTVPSTEIVVANSSDKLDLSDSSAISRLDTGNNRRALILRAFDYPRPGQPASASEKGPISKNANEDRVNAGALVGNAVAPCLRYPRLVPEKLAR